MRAVAIALSLALLTLTAPPARAGEPSQPAQPSQGEALLTVGIIADAGSTATGAACATLLTENLGRAIDNPGPNDPKAFAAIAATCSLNVALGVAGIALTVVGGKKLGKERALHYSLNSLAVHF